MNKIFQIFIRDLKRLSHNWVALIVTIGVCLIPSLYAWFNIAANMDPYSNTHGIRIAVANCDQGTKSDLTGSLNAGDEIVNNLKDNKDLGWQFVAEEKAVSGVKSGTYYAAIVIPNDFSKSLISVLSGEIEQPKITYYLNEKKNAIAPKVTDTGASTIQQEVNNTFVSIVSKTIAETLKTSAGSITGDLGQAKSGLSSNIHKITENIEASLATLDNFQNTFSDSDAFIQDAKGTLDEVINAASSGSETLKKSQEALSSGREHIAGFSAALGSSLTAGEDAFSNISSQAGTDIGKLNEKVQTSNGQIQSMITSLKQITESNQKIIDSLKDLNDKLSSQQIADLIAQLESENVQHNEMLTRLEKGNTNIGNTAAALSSLSSDISGILTTNHGQLQNARHSIEQTLIPGLNQTLDSFALHSGEISGILSGVVPSADQMKSILDDLKTSINDTKTALTNTAHALNQVAEQLHTIDTDLSTLSSSKSYQDFLSLSGMNEEKAAEFMSSPVTLKTKSLYSVENYGSSLTPFYTNLAIWVGGIVLIAIFKLEVDRDEKIRNLNPAHSYFGRWLLFAAVGLVQALIICLGDIIILKIQCLHPVAFIAAGLFASFVYVSLIYALSITFKHIGKALCVILVILQIPGSAGTYPIEMTPGFFQKLHPILPFTYGINAMRETIAGTYGNYYWKYIGILALFLPIAFGIGLGIRPLLLNLNRMFDKRLEETGLMICEEEGMTRERIRLSTAVKILAGQEDFQKRILKKVEKFEANYQKRVRMGFLLIIILPAFFLMLMFGINSKMLFLVLWIASIIGIVLYLICLEYIHENLQRKLQLSRLSHEELLESIHKKKSEEE